MICRCSITTKCVRSKSFSFSINCICKKVEILSSGAVKIATPVTDEIVLVEECTIWFKNCKIQFCVINLKLEAMYSTTLSLKVVVQRDFSINSPNRLYAGVEKVSTYCEGCFGLPTAHITTVVDQEGLMLTCLRVEGLSVV